MAQKVGGAHLHAAVSAHVKFPAGLHRDHAEILDRRLGAITRAPGDGHFHLMRHPRTPGHFFEPDAHAGRVLGAETAPLGTDAGLDRADRFAVGVAGDKAGLGQIAPDLRQGFFAYAEHVNALTTGDVYGGNLVFLRNLGKRAQLRGGCFTAPDARHHGIGAVLLDIGVRPLVDEARLIIIRVVTGPGTQEVKIQRGAALAAAVRCLPFKIFHDRRNVFEFVLLDAPSHLVVRVVGTGAQGFFPGRVGVIAAQRIGQQLLDQGGARATGTRGLGVGAHVFQGEQFLFRYGVHDVAFAYPVTAADFHVVAHGRHGIGAPVTGVTQVRLTE